jgi:hypothetical protein
MAHCNPTKRNEQRREREIDATIETQAQAKREMQKAAILNVASTVRAEIEWAESVLISEYVSLRKVRPQDFRQRLRANRVRLGIIQRSKIYKEAISTCELKG